jgi:hypothetical protein
LAENHSASIADSIRDARQRLTAELRAQADRLQKLDSGLAEVRSLHQRTEQEAARQWEAIERAAELATAAAAATAAETAREAEAAPAKALESVLAAVRKLMTCTVPDRVFELLAEAAARAGARAAVFDVRGKAAWGAAASGFGPALTPKVLQSLIVPLSHDNLFQQVCETAAPVEATAAALKKNRNVLDKLKPASEALVLLLPIRSAGTVSAILYTDAGETGRALPASALSILAEFAGAQMDRLIALSGGFAEEAVEETAAGGAATEEPPAEAAVETPPYVEPPTAAPVASELPSHELVEPVVLDEELVGVESPAAKVEAAAAPVAATSAPVEVAPVAVEPPEIPLVLVEPAPVEPEPVPPAPPAGAFDVSQLSEAEQKVHKDAKRFAKLLVAEIELYNKTKVAEGRKNRDLYKRLKADIDRSRQTFEKRFGKSLDKRFDYFHEELVRSLAGDDPTLLGLDYPGPSA